MLAGIIRGKTAIEVQPFRNEGMPFGISNIKYQISDMKSEICDLKFRVSADTGSHLDRHSVVRFPRSMNNPG
jgi:hypothetical protein